MAPDPDVNVDLQVPDDLDVQYANFLSIWHSAHEFTLDFAITGVPVDADGHRTIPTKVVARLKVPPTVIDDMLRALAENVSRREDMLKAAQRRADPRDQEPPGP